MVCAELDISPLQQFFNQINLSLAAVFFVLAVSAVVAVVHMLAPSALPQRRRGRRKTAEFFGLAVSSWCLYLPCVWRCIVGCLIRVEYAALPVMMERIDPLRRSSSVPGTVLSLLIVSTATHHDGSSNNLHWFPGFNCDGYAAIDAAPSDC